MPETPINFYKVNTSMYLAPKTKTPLSTPVTSPHGSNFLSFSGTIYLFCPFLFWVLFFVFVFCLFLLHIDEILLCMLFWPFPFSTVTETHSHCCLKLKFVLSVWYILWGDGNFVIRFTVDGHLVMMPSAAADVLGHICPWISVRISAAYIPRNKAAGSWGKLMFAFSRLHQTAFHRN